MIKNEKEITDVNDWSQEYIDEYEKKKGKNYNGLASKQVSELEKYMYYYNMTRRHGSLQCELGVKTPLDAVKKWANLNEKRFLGEKRFFVNFEPLL